MRLYSNQQRSFTEIRDVAVAITVVQTGQQHVGILHKEEVLGEVRLAHLAWHNQLKDSQLKDASKTGARCRSWRGLFRIWSQIVGFGGLMARFSKTLAA